MEERVQVALRLAVVRLNQERELEDRGGRVMVSGEELAGELAAAADDDDSAVREDLVGRVPAADGQVGGLLHPIGEGGGRKETDCAVAALETSGLEEGAVGEESAGGAPGVGEDRERADGGGGEVE